MSRIVISTAGGVRNTAPVAEIRGTTGEPVSRIAAALREGTPLFDGDLFARPEEERVGTVRLRVHVLRAAGMEPVVSENGRPMTVEMLGNLMRSSEEIAAWFDEMDELGHTP